MTRKQRRLTLIGAAGAVLALSLGLILYALDEQIVFFFSPSDVIAKEVAPGARIRLGGLVAEGSIEQSGDGGVSFLVTDTASQIPVVYRGILPDLFREGQGVVAEGSFDDSGRFQADSVLARHDEAYMPREVADALKAQGHWQEETTEESR